jgi:TetR/AcrR family transcriptional repressor of mexJK operon
LNIDTPINERRPRGRPRIVDPANRTQAVLSTALELFGEMGFGGVSMDSVASRARLSKETLYQLFPGKPALFKAVLENQIKAWAATETSLRPGLQMGSLRESLERFALTMVSASTSPEFSVLWRLVHEESFRFPEMAAILRENGSDRGVAACAELIEHFACVDGLACRDAEYVARMLTSLVEAWLRDNSLRRHVPTTVETEHWIEHMIDIFMAGRSAW